MLIQEVSLCDLVVIHGLWQYHGMAVRKVCKAFGRPYLVYPHGMLDPWALQQSWSKRLGKSINWFATTRNVLQDASRLCFTCEEEHESARPALQGINTLPAIVPLGVEGPPDDVDTLRDEGRKRHAQFSPTRVVLFLGRLHPKKGCDLLLEAYARWRATHGTSLRTHLRMAGPACSTEYFENLQALCVKLGLVIDQDVSFPGMVSGRDKWQELAAADTLILPSHQENFGIVVGEALACHIPVLLSTRVNIWRWVTEAEAGFADAPTIQGIEKLLQLWFDQSPEKTIMMRNQAKQLFQRKFSLSGTTEQFIQLCALVCGK
jgi:glycosyltransferase involved in cell wall biosynthesis